MGIMEKIKEIEAEMARTQKNKATNVSRYVSMRLQLETTRLLYLSSHSTSLLHIVSLRNAESEIGKAKK